MSGTEDVPTPDDLFRTGGIKDLSNAERRALKDGADLGRVVSTAQRGKRQLTRVTGEPRRLQVFTRRLSGRTVLTPAGVYDLAGDDRALALRLLKENGYLT